MTIHAVDTGRLSTLLLAQVIAYEKTKSELLIFPERYQEVLGELVYEYNLIHVSPYCQSVVSLPVLNAHVSVLRCNVQNRHNSRPAYQRCHMVRSPFHPPQLLRNSKCLVFPGLHKQWGTRGRDYLRLGRRIGFSFSRQLLRSNSEGSYRCSTQDNTNNSYKISRGNKQRINHCSSVELTEAGYSRFTNSQPYVST